MDRNSDTAVKVRGTLEQIVNWEFGSLTVSFGDLAIAYFVRFLMVIS
jgi:hypothetical protein